MKIAFILSYPTFSSTSGILSQGITWKECLESRGHEVVLVNMWDIPDWKIFDAFLFFGFSEYSCQFIKVLSKVNSNIIVAPILDPDYSKIALKIYTHWGNSRLRLSNPFHSLRRVKDNINKFLVRSDFEMEYLADGFSVDVDRCCIIPLSYGPHLLVPYGTASREDFCLHISLLCDERKNVRRLIGAAKKYNFPLKLAGKLKNDQERAKLDKWIGGASNISYLGFISEEEKWSLYKKAKVFALPSINEGVGIVGLEAAAMGCEMVMTNIGGPKEYYGGYAELVDPYDVDEIGRAIMRLLNGTTSNQPGLQSYIKNNYSLSKVAEKLEVALKG